MHIRLLCAYILHACAPVGFEKRHWFPLPGLCRFQHRIGDLIRRQSISESRSCLFTRTNGLEKVGELVSKRMLVTDLQTGYPPMLHIRMLSISDVQASPAPQLAFITVIE